MRRSQTLLGTNLEQATDESLSPAALTGQLISSPETMSVSVLAERLPPILRLNDNQKRMISASNNWENNLSLPISAR